MFGETEESDELPKPSLLSRRALKESISSVLYIPSAFIINPPCHVSYHYEYSLPPLLISGIPRPFPPPRHHHHHGHRHPGPPVHHPPPFPPLPLSPLLLPGKLLILLPPLAFPLTLLNGDGDDDVSDLDGDVVDGDCDDNDGKVHLMMYISSSARYMFKRSRRIMWETFQPA